MMYFGNVAPVVVYSTLTSYRAFAEEPWYNVVTLSILSTDSTTGMMSGERRSSALLLSMSTSS